MSRPCPWLPPDPRFRRTEPVRTLGGMRRLLLAVTIAVAGHRGYRLLTSGAATIDVGVGRRVRRLGPRSWDIAAGRELVFDVIAVGGGLLVALGLWADLGALLPATFVFPVALGMHAFSRFDDPMHRANQQVHFMKNVSLGGAALALFALFQQFGSEL